MANPKALARLLRLPLFVTAVADALAGYTVAILSTPVAFDWRVNPLLAPRFAFDGGRMALVAGVSAGLYLFGMVENDLVDVRRDALLKKPRPLVTGDVSIGGAVALLMMTGGLAAFCAMRLPGEAILLAFATFAAINLYNLAAKQGPAYIAMIVMGLCRLLNFGMGVTAAIGVPRGPSGWGLVPPTGPLWMCHGAALFLVAAMVTGYSIAARRRSTVSSRPWQALLIVALVGGIGMWIAARFVNTIDQFPAQDFGGGGTGRFLGPPVARVFALLVLAALWPGRLWSPLGSDRKPESYEPFVERALYWLILLDAAFVVDAWIVHAAVLPG